MAQKFRPSHQGILPSQKTFEPAFASGESDPHFLPMSMDRSAAAEVSEPLVYWTPAMLQKLEKAISDRNAPEARLLQRYLDESAERSKLLIHEISETERLSAEDYAIRINTIE